MDSVPVPATNRSWVLAHLIIILFIGGAFAPWWAGKQVLAPLDILTELMVPWRGDQVLPQVHNHFVSDAVTQYLPYRWLAQRSFHEDGFIGWNNLTAGGINQYANTMALYFDWTMQLHRWFDFWTAWHLGLMAQFAVAGCGMLIFLQSRRISPWCALPAAVVYLLNFQFIAWLYHRWALSAFCWVPWLLWALMSWREGHRRRWGLILLFLALSFLGGTLQHAAFVVLVVVALWLAWSYSDRQQPRVVWRTSGMLLLFGLGGIILAAPMFVPCITAYIESLGAGQLRGGLGYPGGKTQPVLNLGALVLYLFPHVLGSPDTLDLWKLLKSNLFNVAYIGLLPLLTGVAAVFSRRFSLEARLLVIVGVVVPLTPLLGPLYHRVLLVALVGAVWLFAQALQYEREWLRKLAHRAGVVVLIVAAIWLVASVFIGVTQARLQEVITQRLVAQPGGQFACLPDWLRLRGERWVSSLLIWQPRNLIPLLALLAGLVVVRRGPASVWTGLTLTVLLTVETGTYARHWVTFSDRPAVGLFPETEETRVLRALVGDGVIHLRRDTTCRMPFPPNTLQAYGLRTWESYESILPRGMGEYVGTNSNPARLALCGVTHLVAAAAEPITEPAWIEVWRNPAIAVYENSQKWPRYCALPENTTWSVDHPQRLDAPVEVVAETQNRRTLRVPTGARCVRVAENWSANWEYTVDNRTWRRAQRGSDGSLLLPLPAVPPDQTVRMRYRPRWFPFRLGRP